MKTFNISNSSPPITNGFERHSTTLNIRPQRSTSLHNTLQSTTLKQHDATTRNKIPQPLTTIHPSIYYAFGEMLSSMLLSINPFLHPSSSLSVLLFP